MVALEASARLERGTAGAAVGGVRTLVRVTAAPPPAFPPGPPPPGAPLPGPPRRNRTGAIVAIVLAVVVVLCIGSVAAVVYFARRVDWDNLTGDGKPTPTPPSTEQPATTALDCRVAEKTENTKDVGRPDFAAAPRTGQATMTITTNRGEIVISMDRAKTPCTVASFAHLAGKKFFDGSSCHRLVTDGIFVLQCGDPRSDGTGGPDYTFADENLAGATYDRGVVAMANAGPDTNGSQFFIVYRASQLPPNYTPFGEVRTGIELVDQVAAGGHDNAYGEVGGGHPKTQVLIQGLTVS